MNWVKLTTTVVMLATALSLTACGGGGGGGGGGGNGGAAQGSASSLDLAIKALAGFLNGAFGAGVAVNDLGQSVGVADNGTTLQAVKWDAALASPTPTALNSLIGGNEYSAAYAINESNLIVGESSDGTRPVAVFWSAGSTTASPLSLTGLFAGGTSAALGINDNSEIVGEAVADLLGNTVAVFWSSQSAEPLILENLSTLPAAYSAAYDINNAQVVIGESLSAQGVKVPVAWLPDGTGGFNPPVALPLLPTHVEGVALALNDVEDVVGESMAANGTIHGVIWSINPDGSILSTRDLGPDTSLAAINDTGLVGGHLNAGSGSDEATLWSSGNLADSKTVTNAFSQVYGLNDNNWAVGSANGAGFVAVPQ